MTEARALARSSRSAKIVGMARSPSEAEAADPKSTSGATESRLRAAKTRRAETTRARIRSAANDLFLDRGVDGTTVDAIVERAGVSKGTFYVHYDRKEDLLLEYGLRRLERVRQMVPELVEAPSLRVALERIVDDVIRGKEWGRELTGLALTEMGTSAERLPIEAPHELLIPLVEQARSRGEVRRDIPTAALCQFIMRSVLGALRDWGLGTEELDREAAIATALTLVFDAVSAEREASTR